MSEVKKAAFTFEGYQVKKFTFEEPIDHKSDSFTLAFEPSGVYTESTGIFQLKFDFRTFIQGNLEQDVITAEVIGDFKFIDKVPFEEIPDYFYKNSIAIVFPYLRAFVSTLTFQANIKPIILPVMNLGGLEETFRKKTIKI